MQQDLLGSLVDKPQRETAGGDAASRFDFQKNWAFCEMLRRHMVGADYLVAFEYHDDVLFLEPSTTPTKAQFYQVKTSDPAKPRKVWTLLTRRKGSSSILAKMVSNVNGICEKHGPSVILVSNVAFEFNGKDVCAADLEDKLRDQIVEKLSEELEFDAKTLIDKIHFLVCGVSIDAINSYLQGEVAELFKFQFGEEHGLNIHSWTRLVQGEIARRNNFPSSEVKDVEHLRTRKCIDRNFIEKSLLTVKSTSRPRFDVQLSMELLRSSGYDQNTIIRISKRLPEVVSDRSDPTNDDVNEIMRSIDDLLQGVANEEPSLAEFMTLVEEQFEHVFDENNPYKRRPYILAAGLMVYYDQL